VTGAHAWRGRRGVVLLGPTEHRVALYLVDRTRPGRVAIRTAELARSLNLERSEAYRITARLRVLGLFGIRNDRGGTLGGRWYWRTAIEHDGAGLDGPRHRRAWARLLGVARARARRVADHLRRAAPAALGAPATRPPVGPPPAAAATFRAMFAAGGGGDLLRQWKA
jgi:predicted transcriptional regulator